MLPLLIIAALFKSAWLKGFIVEVMINLAAQSFRNKNFAMVVLTYSALGGMHASLRTDFFQMLIFLLVLTVLIIFTVFNPDYS